MSAPTFGAPHAPYLPDRIRLRLVVTETAPGVLCWLWTGARSNGYGAAARGDGSGRMRGAHVLVYAASGRVIPPGYDLGHTCHDDALAAGTCAPGVCVHRACANPAHLRPMSRAENVRSGGVALLGRGLCRAGLHDTTAPGSTVRHAGDAARCRACRAITQAATDRRRRPRRTA